MDLLPLRLKIPGRIPLCPLLPPTLPRRGERVEVASTEWGVDVVVLSGFPEGGRGEFPLGDCSRHSLEVQGNPYKYGSTELCIANAMFQKGRVGGFVCCCEHLVV